MDAEKQKGCIHAFKIMLLTFCSIMIIGVSVSGTLPIYLVCATNCCLLQVCIIQQIVVTYKHKFMLC